MTQTDAAFILDAYPACETCGSHCCMCPGEPSMMSKDSDGIRHYDKLDDSGKLKPEYLSPFIASLMDLDAAIQKHGRDAVLFPALVNIPQEMQL